MSLFRRVRDVLKANINHIIDTAEDPEKMLEQLMRELREERKQVKQQVVKSIADEKRLEQQVRDHQEKLNQWQKRAEVAVMRDEDELAREAISRRNSSATMVDELTRQWEEQHQMAEQLKDGLDQLNRKLDEAEFKKQYLLTELRAAKTKVRATDTIAKLTNTDRLDEFEKVKSKIQEQRALADATGEMAFTEMEDKFSRLESEGVVDHDLIQLKLQMGKSVPELPGANGAGPAALPGASASQNNGNSGAGTAAQPAPGPAAQPEVTGIPQSAADADEAASFA